MNSVGLAGDFLAAAFLVTAFFEADFFAAFFAMLLSSPATSLDDHDHFSRSRSMLGNMIDIEPSFRAGQQTGPDWSDLFNPRLGGTSDAEGRVFLPFEKLAFDIQTRPGPKMSHRVLVLQEDGRFEKIERGLLQPFEVIRLPEARHRDIEIRDHRDRVLAGAVIEILMIDDLALPRRFSESGRLRFRSDEKGQCRLPFRFKTAFLRIAHPEVGEGAQFIVDSREELLLLSTHGPSSEDCFVVLDESATTSWPLRLSIWMREKPRLHASWTIELNKGRPLRLRTGGNAVLALHAATAADGMALEPQLDETGRHMTLSEHRWRPCRGRFTNRPESDRPREIHVLFGLAVAPLAFFCRSEAAVDERGAFKVHHPGRAAHAGWDNCFRFGSFTELGLQNLQPEEVHGELRLAIDLSEKPVDPRTLNMTDTSIHVYHQVSGRVLGPDGRPAAFQPVIASTRELNFFMELDHLDRLLDEGDYLIEDSPSLGYRIPQSTAHGVLVYADAEGRFSLSHDGPILRLSFGWKADSPSRAVGRVIAKARISDFRVNWTSEAIEVRLPE